MATDTAQQRTTSQIAIFIYSSRLHRPTFRLWAIDLKTKPRVLYKMGRIARAKKTTRRLGARIVSYPVGVLEYTPTGYLVFDGNTVPR